MADDTQAPQNDSPAPGVETADSSNVTTLDALQLDGKGQDGLEDATEGDLPESAKADNDDVAGFANVQSAGRATFEEMNAGAPNEGPATPTSDNVQREIAPATNPDNHVDAKFENPQPANGPAATPQLVEAAAPPPPAPAIERPQERVDDPRPDPKPDAAPLQDEAAPPADAATVAAPVAAIPVVVPPVVLDPEDPTPKVAQTPSLVLTIQDGVEDVSTTSHSRLMYIGIDPKLQNSDGGTESLSVSISGVPDGFSFADANGNALGTDGGGGTWTFSWSSGATGLYLVRPEHYSGRLSLEVSAIATESNGDTASVTQTASLLVHAVADAPTFDVSHVAGMENTSISIGDHITASLVDTDIQSDSAEQLFVIITPKAGAPSGGYDMPTGTTLNHGTYYATAADFHGHTVPAGSWVVAAADLPTLTVTPPANVSHDFTFSVSALTWEPLNDGSPGDNVFVTAAKDLRVDVGIVDPTVAGSGSGNEDTWIALDLSAHVNAADGTEHLTVWLENLPADAELRYAGSHAVLTPDANGRYDVSASLQNLEVHWKTAHQDADISFKLRAVAQDADALNSGDTPDRNTGLDGTVTGIAGSHAPDTSQTLADVTVVVKAVADAPTLTANGIGVEDKYAALNIATGLVDADGSESLTTVYVQPGVNAPAGMVIKIYDSAHGTLTDAPVTTQDLTLDGGVVIPAGSFAIPVADLSKHVRVYGLDANADTDFHVSVTSVTTEGASDAQTAVHFAHTTVDVPVTVFSDADTPTVAVVDARQVIAEDSSYNLHADIGGGQFAVMSTNGVDSADGSQSIIQYQVKPIETGSRLFVNGVEQTLPAADANGDRYWSLDPADVAAGRVTVAGPADWGSLTLDKHFDIRSVTREADYAADTSGLFDGLGRTPTAISAWDRLTLGINPVADTPTVDTNAAHSYAIGVEDKYAAIASSSFSGHSTDVDGSESLSYYIQPGSNAPAGMVVKVYDNGVLTDAVRVDSDTHLSDGTLVKAGSYLVSSVQASAGHVRVYGLDANSDGANHTTAADFHVSVTAVTTDGNSTAGTSVDVPVTMFGDADTPTVAVVDARQVINEDSTYNLHTAIGGGNFAVAGAPTDTDGSESIIQYQVKPVETGSRLFVNGVEQTLPAADANGDRYWVVTAADVTGGKVTVAGPTNWGDWTLDKHFDIRSVTREADYAADTSGLFDGLGRTPTALSAWDRLTLGINPVADAPTLTSSGVGVEDKYAVLNISTAVTDTDGSEQVSAVYVSGLTGGETLNHGTVLTSNVPLANGAVITAGSYKLTTAELSGLRVENLPANSDADFNLTVTSVSSEKAADGSFTGPEAVTSVTSAVTIFGDADKPTVAVVDGRQVIAEDTQYNLHTALGGGGYAVVGAPIDTDGSESIIQYQIKPQEAGDRLWVNGVEQTLPAADANGNRYWTVNASDLTGGLVKVGGPANWGDWNVDRHFDIRSVTREGDYQAVTTSLTGTGLTRATLAYSDWDTLTLGINPVADTPSLTASGVGVEDKYAVLNISSALVDTDGSEQLTVYVAGLTGGRTLNHGTVLTSDVTLANGSVITAGSYKLTSAELSGLRIENLPLNSDDDFSVTVTSVATEKAADGSFTGGLEAVKTVTASVSIFGDADQPSSPVVEPAQTINEDTFYDLRTLLPDGTSHAVDGVLADPTRESLSQFHIKPIEAGSRLTLNGAEVSLPSSGYWTVSAADLFAGKVAVGGGANWSSLSNQLHFDIQVSTVEADAGANTSALTSAGLSRVDTAWSVWDRLTLQVDPVADGTTVGAQSSGNEDAAITVAPTFTLTDTDGSESLSGDVIFSSSDPDMIAGTIQVGGVTITPVAQGDGSYQWSIPHAAITPVNGSAVNFTLSGVTFTPSLHNAGDMTYTIQVTTQDITGAFTHVTTATGCSISVAAVADQPTIAVGQADAGGVVHLTEDTGLNLGLVSTLVDGPNANGVGPLYNPDPEHFSYIGLEGIPAGWTVLKDNHNGTYSQISVSGGIATLTNETLADILLKPPTNLNWVSAADAATPVFRFKSISAETENASTATNYVDFKVTIDAVADTPTVQITHVRLNEDTRVVLDIRPAVTDLDGSESITDIFLGGVPTGTAFYDAAAGGTAIGTSVGGGVWKFAKADLAHLYLQPTHDSNVDFDLSVTVRATESSNGSTADSVVTALHVDIKGISDGPYVPPEHLNGVTLIASGNEDTVIDPGFGSYHPADIDGSETLSVVIKEIPANVTMTMTTGNEKFAKYLGTDAQGHEQWSIDPNHLGDVRFSTPHDWAGDFTVKLDLITTENDGNSMVSSRDLVVSVNQVADTPYASVSSSIAEDGWSAAGIPVTFNASPEDVTAGGLEHISHVEAQFNFASLGLPNGTVLTLEINGQDHTLVSGEWIDITASYGSAMHVKGVPEDWSKDIPVTLKATSSEYDAGGAILNSAVKTVNGSVQIIAVADQPETFTLADTVTTTNGSPADLGLSLTLGDHDGSEPSSIYYLIEGVPNGVLLNHGMNTGGGYWIVPYTAGDASWHLTASSNFTGSATLTIHPVIKDNDPDGGSNTLHVTAKTVTLTITDDGGGSGGWPTNTSAIAAPTLGGVKAGTEDINFNLDHITATAGDGASAVSAIVVTGVQSGASVSGGYYNWLTGSWAVAPDHVGDLVIDPPADYAGDVTATLRAVAMDANGAYAYSASTTAVVATLVPDTDGANVSVTTSLASGGRVEDVANIPITITVSQRDVDHSETLVGGTVTVKIAADAELYLDGVKQTGTNGSYVLNISDLHSTGSYAAGSLSLTGLSVVPPAQYHGSLSIQATVTGNDPGDVSNPTSVSTTGSLSLNLTAVADTPTITAHAVTGNEDTLIALDVTIATPDVSGVTPYGSEFLSVKIGGVPANGVVDGALKNSDGTWTVKDANMSLVQENGAWVAKLSGVRLLPPQDDSGAYTLSVTAYTIEPSNHSIATATASFTVTVNGVADTPTIDPTAVNNGFEDTPLLINLNAQLLDLSESLSVTITGLPAGASFTDAAGLAIGAAGAGGAWVLQHSDLFNANGSAKPVYVLGNLNDSGSWTMTAQATSVDGTTHADSNIKTFSVTLAGVADTPTLTLTDTASGNEDTDIAVSIGATTPDLVGETVEVLIGGAPAGAVFVNGTTLVAASGDGFWHLPSALLDANLKIRPPGNYNGDITLTVQAHTTEGATSGYSDSQTLTVHVSAINDAPDAVLHGATGQSEVAGVTSPIYVIPEGQANYVDINDNADGVANPTLARMDISIDKWDGSATAPAGNHDGISLTGLEPRLDTSGNLVVDFDNHTFGLTYNSGTHTMTLTGAAGADTYEALAKSVILTSTTGTLDVGVRTLGISVYDQAGLTDKVETTATIGDATHSLNVTLTGDMLGTVQWGANGSVSLLGSSGDDTLVLSGGDNVVSLGGGAGIDQLLMQTASHGHGDWLFTMDANTSDIIATSQSDPDHGGFVVHLDQGTATVSADQHEVAFTNATGSITFNDDHHQVAISQIEKMAIG